MTIRSYFRIHSDVLNFQFSVTWHLHHLCKMASVQFFSSAWEDNYSRSFCLNRWSLGMQTYEDYAGCSLNVHFLDVNSLSTSTVSGNGFFSANCKAVWSLLSINATSLPLWQQQWHHFRSYFSGTMKESRALTSHPWSTNESTMSLYPLRAARCGAVVPDSSAVFLVTIKFLRAMYRCDLDVADVRVSSRFQHKFDRFTTEERASCLRSFHCQ